MYFIINLTLLAIAASCLQASDVLEESDAQHSCAIKGGEGPYDYDSTGTKGPEYWGTLDPEYEACGNGMIQSPIDFPKNVNYAPLKDGPLPTLEKSDFKFAAGFSNWALNCATDHSCGYTMFGGKKFYLANMHFHSPSEHTLDGKTYPLEAHYVHASEEGDFVVIATMFEYAEEGGYAAAIAEGAHVDYGKNEMLQYILSSMESETETMKVSPGDIIDASMGYCTYTGSLTTPPCTEGVTFLMSMNVATVSKRQVYKYFISAGAGYDGNNRPAQPLNDREIMCYV